MFQLHTYNILILKYHCYILIELKIDLPISCVIFLDLFYLLHYIWEGKDFCDSMTFHPFRMLSPFCVVTCSL